MFRDSVMNNDTIFEFLNPKIKAEDRLMNRLTRRQNLEFRKSEF